MQKSFKVCLTILRPGEVKVKTNDRLNSFEVNEKYLLLIIKNLNANNAHGWNDISIQIIQTFGSQ